MLRLGRSPEEGASCDRITDLARFSPRHRKLVPPVSKRVDFLRNSKRFKIVGVEIHANVFRP
jgi:hypothetical protein